VQTEIARSTVRIVSAYCKLLLRHDGFRGLERRRILRCVKGNNGLVKSEVTLPSPEGVAIKASESFTNPGQTNSMPVGLGLATWMKFYTYDAVNLVLPRNRFSIWVAGVGVGLALAIA
jgi:hypothetical protein